ncbi:hypothetical protein C0993_004321, partial [Termitomyces sp. T159_Od127]
AFERLPDSKAVEFIVVPPLPLGLFLPNLPDISTHIDEPVDLSSVHSPDKTMKDGALDLVERLLVYPAENRLPATRALEHPWFGGKDGLLLPSGYPRNLLTYVDMVIEEVEGKPLGYWVQKFLCRNEPHS